MALRNEHPHFFQTPQSTCNVFLLNPVISTYTDTVHEPVFFLNHDRHMTKSESRTNVFANLFEGVPHLAATSGSITDIMGGTHPFHSDCNNLEEKKNPEISKISVGAAEMKG